MSVIAWFAAAATSAAGGFITAVCGFGMGPVTMSVLPYVMPYSRAVAVTGLFGLVLGLIIVWEGRRSVNVKTLIPCAAAGLISSSLAAGLSAGAAEKIMVRGLGVLLMLLSVYSVFFSGRIKIRATPLNGLLAGAIGGTLTGMFSVGGPPIAIYMLAATESNDEYRSTLNAHFSIVNICAAASRFFAGSLTGRDFLAFLKLLTFLGLGMWAGDKVFHRLDAAKLRKAVYAYLFAAGLSMLLR